MATIWFDESPPVGPSEHERLSAFDLSGLVISPAMAKALDAYARQIRAYITGAIMVPNAPASAGTHHLHWNRRTGKTYIYSTYDECGNPVQGWDGSKTEPKPKPKPEPNRDKGRVNNTGPRRGQQFGHKGRRRY